MSEDVYQLMATWWKGLNLTFKGVRIGDALSYDLAQILIRRREQEREQEAAQCEAS